MFLSFFVSSIESALMTIEAGNVIVLRLQTICKGDKQAQREAELMIWEKLEAFGQAGIDAMTGVTNATIRDNLRVAVRANESRLIAMRLAG